MTKAVMLIFAVAFFSLSHGSCQANIVFTYPGLPTWTADVCGKGCIAPEGEPEGKCTKCKDFTGYAEGATEDEKKKYCAYLGDDEDAYQQEWDFELLRFPGCQWKDGKCKANSCPNFAKLMDGNGGKAMHKKAYDFARTAGGEYLNSYKRWMKITCNQAGGCLTAITRGRCSVWAIWALVLFLSCLIVFIIAAVVLAVVVIYFKVIVREEKESLAEVHPDSQTEILTIEVPAEIQPEGEGETQGEAPAEAPAEDVAESQPDGDDQEEIHPEDSEIQPGLPENMLLPDIDILGGIPPLEAEIIPGIDFS